MNAWAFLYNYWGRANIIGKKACLLQVVNISFPTSVDRGLVHTRNVPTAANLFRLQA